MRRIAGDRQQIKASEWNQIADAVQMGRRTNSVSRTQPWYVWENGRNRTGEVIAAGVPVLLGAWTPQITGGYTGGRPNGYFDCWHAYLPTTVAEADAMSGSIQRIGVTLDQIGINEVGRIAIGGLVAAKVGSTGPYAKPHPKSNAAHKIQFQSGNWGVRIVGYSSDGIAIVNLDDTNWEAIYTLSEIRKAPPTGTDATIDGVAGFVVDSLNCAFFQSIGDRGVAVIRGNRFVIQSPWGNASSEQGVAFVLTSVPTYGAFNSIQTATAKVLFPNGVLGGDIVIKFIGRVRGKIGSRGFAVYQLGEWISTSLQQPALRMRATAASAVEPSDTTKTVTVIESHTSFPYDISPLTFDPPSSSIEVDNPKSLFGFEGAKIDLVYNSETDRYFIDSIQKHAWRIKGTLEDEMLPSDSEIKLEYVTGLDGVLNESIVTDGFVMAKNTHHWNGVSGATARAEYNWDLGQWELYQIDCEEDPPEEE